MGSGKLRIKRGERAGIQREWGFCVGSRAGGGALLLSRSAGKGSHTRLLAASHIAVGRSLRECRLARPAGPRPAPGEREGGAASLLGLSAGRRVSPHCLATAALPVATVTGLLRQSTAGLISSGRTRSLYCRRGGGVGGGGAKDGPGWG